MNDNIKIVEEFTVAVNNLNKEHCFFKAKFADDFLYIELFFHVWRSIDNFLEENFE